MQESDSEAVPEIPTSVADLERFVANQIQESVHLDYKRSKALSPKAKGDFTVELIKDVSAFANSDGGLLLYGIAENDDHLPEQLDGGIDDTEIWGEKIEHHLSTGITPRLSGVVIKRVPAGEGRSYFAISVPKSDRGPHQSTLDKHFYKRFNFESVRMHAYEIADVSGRRHVTKRLIDVRPEITRRSGYYLVVENIGDVAAEQLSFGFSNMPRLLREAEAPRLLTTAVEWFGPGFRMDFLCGGRELLGEDDEKLGNRFTVEATYRHAGTGKVVADSFCVDFRDYLGSSARATELEDLGDRIEKPLKDVVQELKRLNEHVSALRPLVSPTGLSVSFRSLRNLGRLRDGRRAFEKLDATRADPGVFREVLGVGPRLAHALFRHFRGWGGKSLDDVEGLTPELRASLREAFETDEPTRREMEV